MHGLLYLLATLVTGVRWALQVMHFLKARVFPVTELIMIMTDRQMKKEIIFPLILFLMLIRIHLSLARKEIRFCLRIFMAIRGNLIGMLMKMLTGDHMRI